MSQGYGFLTQSTIIPKKSKQIKLSDNSGQILLQSIMQKQKQKLKNKQKPETLPTVVNRQEKKNAGIQKRIRKDEQDNQKIKLTQKNYYKILEKKAEVYNKVGNKKVNIDKLLVDFEGKHDLKESNKDEEDQYQKAREAFYKGQIKNIERQQQNLHEQVESENNGTSMMRQRLAWAKEMLSQMSGVQQLQNKPKVFQSFDQKLTKQEKQAFDKILGQQQQQRIKLQAIKRRKILMQQQKLRKLRKLNLIRDAGEAAALQREKNKDTVKQKKQEESEQQDHNGNK